MTTVKGSGAQAAASRPRLSPSFADGDVSYWWREIGIPKPRAALSTDIDVDVAIVGGGFTGLWTAYYLKREQPDLRVAILEKNFVGFGASGRNGGWLSAEIPGDIERYARAAGLDAARRFKRAMVESIDEVIDVTRAEGIDADIQKDGVLGVATNAAQRVRIQASVASQRQFGWGPEDLIELTAAETGERIHVANAVCGMWSPHCARIQPARLIKGLAAAACRRGVDIYEGTMVQCVDQGVIRTDHGTVRAPITVLALEGFTASLPGRRRSWLPMSSSMIVTTPLPEQIRQQIGWEGAELLGDAAHGFAYAQRTRDGRIAIGGRAVPYRFGSRTDHRGETKGDSVDQLRGMLARLFPATVDVEIEHAWAGVLGVPRDWCATVGLDELTGLAWAGGYVGHGVSATNLAGRTLTDLILKRRTDLLDLPWVDRHVRRWEPEPLRWLAVHGLYRAYALADRLEARPGATQTSVVAKLANRIAGR